MDGRELHPLLHGREIVAAVKTALGTLAVEDRSRAEGGYIAYLVGPRNQPLVAVGTRQCHPAAAIANMAGHVPGNLSHGRREVLETYRTWACTFE